MYDLTGQVRLDNTRTWKELGRSVAGRNPLNLMLPIAFSPDGSTAAIGLAVLATRPVRLLDGSTLEPLPLQLPGLPQRPSRVVDLEYSADGTRIAAVFHLYRRDPELRVVGKRALVWDMTTPDWAALGSVKTSEPEPDGQFRGNGVALSPDGQTMYTSSPLSAYEIAMEKRSIARTHTERPEQRFRLEPGRQVARGQQVAGRASPARRHNRSSPARAART